jgi:hypothetical protein
LWRNIWGEACRNRLVVANEVTKNIKIKKSCGLKRLQNIVKKATINTKRAASMDERWYGTRARWRVQAERDLIVLGVIELGGGGKLR